MTNNRVSVVVHFLPTAGNNAVGVAWKAAALKAGLSGGAPSPWGDPAEAAAIVAGDTIEITLSVEVGTTGSLAVQRATIQDAVDRAIAARKTEWAIALQYAGYGEGTVT
jgi:hypothetical protein